MAGDVPGTGIKQYTSITDIDTCAGHCDNTTNCCSFEYSPKEMFCNLNAECKPTAPVYKDEVFCGNFFYNLVCSVLILLLLSKKVCKTEMTRSTK